MRRLPESERTYRRLFGRRKRRVLTQTPLPGLKDALLRQKLPNPSFPGEPELKAPKRATVRFIEDMSQLWLPPSRRKARWKPASSTVKTLRSMLAEKAKKGGA